MRSSALDVLRAVAVILVFSRHSGTLPILSHIGWMGVDLFFVLSGFLVSGLLFREYLESGQVRAGRFLVRRGFKIYPQFYALTAITIAVAVWRGTPLPGQVIAADVTFLQSYFPGIWGHTWSLAVEEHFYLMLAAAIVFQAKRGGDDPFRMLPRWILVIFAAALGARVVTWWYRPEWSYAVHLYPSHLRIDSLLAGVLLSYYHVFHGPALLEFMNRFRSWLAPVSLLMLTPALFLEQEDPLLYTVGFSAIWLGFALLLLIVVYPVRVHPNRSQAAPGRAERALAGLGRVSYAFYLWHIPTLAVFDWAFGVSAWPRLLAFGGTLIAAFVSTWMIEVPFLRLRDRWFPSAVKEIQLPLGEPAAIEARASELPPQFASPTVSGQG